MADVICPFTSAVSFGWRPNSGESRAEWERKLELHAPRLLSGAEKALTPDLWQAHCWYPSLQAEPVYNLQVPPLYPSVGFGLVGSPLSHCPAGH